METLAIVGSGIAGMGCAHLLQNRYNIQVFEQNNYIGGHTNTIAVNEGAQEVYMDTGFMVFNYKTYPNLCQLFDTIKAPVIKTDMSFSVQHTLSGLEYCGSGLNGLFAQRKNILKPSYIKMLLAIARFNKESVRIMDDPRYANYTIAQYIHEFKFGEDMLWKYLVPMSSAVWSTPMDKMLDFPAQTLIRFFYNHGFLGLNTQHQWYTLHQGSQAYRRLLIEPFKERIHINKKVTQVQRSEKGVTLSFEDATQQTFDKVILAAHANQSLTMLAAPTELEQRILSCFKYQHNLATVHTDESIMPKARAAWSSWNYRIEEHNGQQVPTTIYWMNRLQGVSNQKNYFVSINALPDSIHPSKVIREINYEHPLFDNAAISAQAQLPHLNQTGPVYFCGSYFKYGFHEDAYASAVNLCKNL